jgi:5-methylcytosine-specific restriction endonuclease McrA
MLPVELEVDDGNCGLDPLEGYPPRVSEGEERKMRLTMELKLRVFRRDKWICRYCERPVVFHPALRLLQEFVKQFGFDGVAYYQQNWSHANAPLLDYSGAVIDHKQPVAKGGQNNERNLITSCNKCNGSKNDRPEGSLPDPKPVRSKHGAPMKWDGLSAVFITFATLNPERLTSQERRWLQAMGNPRLSFSSQK